MNKRGLITIAVIFIGLFVIFFGFSMVMLTSVGGIDNGPQVGVVEVIGPITDSKKAVQNIRRFVKDDNIKALVIRVDSPGGSVGPSQEIYDAVKKAKAIKPLVVSMGSTAASGGYYIACGADTVYANPGTITGSIGVITQVITVDKLVEKADIEVHTVATGKFKDSGSPFKEFSVDDEVYFRSMIDDIYDQFVEDVAACRKLDETKVRELADGRVYTGRQAKKNKLVDELGSMQDAVDFVAKKAKLDGEPTLVYPPEETSFLSQALSASVDNAIDTVQKRTAPTVEYRWVGP
jgi:protease-4